MSVLWMSRLERLKLSLESKLQFLERRGKPDCRYDFDHAFATALKGSDNIISFTTAR